MRSLLDSEKTSIEKWVRGLQDTICLEFEKLENESGDCTKFKESLWDRPGGGSGRMRIMRGELFEKVGVNASTVFGDVSQQMRSFGFADSLKFWACGISLVTHMRSPFIPTVHMNTRVICSDDRYWFGGGADLTPVFPSNEDTTTFHDAMRDACERYRPDSYDEYKRACDEYFFIKHRNEPRGVGGIFYDHLQGPSFSEDFSFMQAVGMNLLRAYSVIVKRNIEKVWTPAEKRQQLEKRAKYVEFNLVYDRGTKFGFVTGANPEAILMSLPPEATW